MTARKLLRFLPEQCEDVKQGRKTMTRRPVALQAEIGTSDEISWVHGPGSAGVGWYSYVTEYPDEGALFYECPYGAVGDTVPLLQPNDHEFAKGRIMSISVERVQEIDPVDAAACEGWDPGPGVVDLAGNPINRDPVAWFRRLWDSIYADKGLGWEADPWVWVVGFKVVG